MISPNFQCSNPVCQLTPRQAELLQRLAANPGATNRELARQLHISERTVKKHLQGIYRAMDVQSRTECLVLLLSKGSAQKGRGSEKEKGIIL